MARIAVVGGTSVGDAEAPAIWDDAQEGVARLLRQAIMEGLDRVALIGAKPDGELYVASTARSAEETMGFFQRGIGHLDRWATSGGDPNEDDGA